MLSLWENDNEIFSFYTLFSIDSHNISTHMIPCSIVCYRTLNFLNLWRHVFSLTLNMDFVWEPPKSAAATAKAPTTTIKKKNGVKKKNVRNIQNEISPFNP